MFHAQDENIIALWAETEFYSCTRMSHGHRQGHRMEKGYELRIKVTNEGEDSEEV